MRNSTALIRANKEIAEGFFEMVLQMPETEEERKALQQIRPGQFVNLKLSGRYLRRPISICDWDEKEGTITIVYKVVGGGTQQMSGMKEGEKMDLLWPLGNGYDLSGTGGRENESQSLLINGSQPLLIGGGAGVPPMAGLCRMMKEQGMQPVVILGFRSAKEMICRERFEDLGIQPIIATEDGSNGVKGFVTDAIRKWHPEKITAAEHAISGVYACGPEAMLRAVDQVLPKDLPGQLSFEERMGCGFGACMGCSCRTKYGSKRICKEGPVLERGEIVW